MYALVCSRIFDSGRNVVGIGSVGGELMVLVHLPELFLESR